MPKTLISLGANLGNVRETMLAAKRMLREKFPSQSQFVFSHLYRTPPVGGPSGQSDFLNAVVCIDHPLSVWEVWDIVKSIESELGRQRQHRWESRRIDVDVLLHDDLRIWTPHFKVPHPRMCMRSFILKPSLEIAPNMIDPVSMMTIEQLFERIKSQAPTVVLTPEVGLTNSLRSSLASQYDSCDIHWHTLGIAESHPFFEKLKPRTPRLTIVAVSTPDPESVLWEDYSRSWAVLLGMDQWRHGSIENPKVHLSIGPRYLLPANDVSWASHEIQAAVDAMNCAVEIAYPFD
ncbi:MAG: 2-amino-4-hydroxy-6-hydroxymethyldihydropteridine diphosphokinase [Pirellula sp.]|jgi:2-amino-4-hydroxy-6-hydroxymethyldihydropteridine diphosphokinase|nr:2-amino-4-hydroxy-6-hydroxymethyldihydropteridine diphosphokinase [Pirellula sp.]